MLMNLFLIVITILEAIGHYSSKQAENSSPIGDPISICQQELKVGDEVLPFGGSSIQANTEQESAQSC